MRIAFDKHLDAALEFAASHAPCIVVVDTILAYDKAIMLLSQHGQVFGMSGGMSFIARRDSLRAFDQKAEPDKKKFLVAMRRMLVNCGLRLSHPTHLATSGVIQSRDEQQLRGLAARTEGQFTEHLIHTISCTSSGDLK